MQQPDFSPKFLKQFEKLPKEIRHIWVNKLELFEQNFRHPSLRTKKMKGHNNIWELSITMDFRATFEVFDDKIIFRKIGDHSILQNP